MVGIIIRWLVLTFAIGISAYLFEGIRVRDFFSVFVAAALLGLLNVSLRPILILLTLPINILSLGLITFLINALMLKTASWIIEGFEVHGFWTAIFGSLFISIVSWFLNVFINRHGRVEIVYLKKGGDQ